MLAVAWRALDGKGFDGSLVHLRDVFRLQLYKLCRAGVFAGLDSQSESETRQTHPPCASGFLVLGANQRPHAPVAKWLTRRSAKPVYTGSIPVRCSKVCMVSNERSVRSQDPLMGLVVFCQPNRRQRIQRLRSKTSPVWKKMWKSGDRIPRKWYPIGVITSGSVRKIHLL